MELQKLHNLILDDDPSIARSIERITEIPLARFESMEGLIQEMGNLNPAAAFIDVHLGPTQSGLEAIPLLRSKWPNIPLIVLTSDSSDVAIEMALAAGADDFLRKPLQPAELKARLNARMEQKVTLAARQIMRYGDITLSCPHQRLCAHGKTAYVSLTALNLLCSLIEMKGAPLSREVLKRKVWGKLTLTDNALDRKVYEVRKALTEVDSNIIIQNNYGQGYQIAAPKNELKSNQEKQTENPNPKAVNIISPGKKAPIRVLLVEDHDADAVLVREALRKGDAGVAFDLKRAKNLAEGLALAEKGGFDVTLLDLSLPDSLGLETFTVFAERFPSLPIIILSGTSDSRIALEGVCRGAQNFLSKDEIGSVALSQTIQYTLARFQLSILERSALKEKQAQLESLSRLKSQFLANMSHEIRTPMNAIIGMTSILTETKLSNEQFECVNTIRSSGQALLHIINDILDFSKFQSGKVALESTPFPLRTVVEEVIDLFAAEVDTKGLSLFESIDSALPPFITGDSTRLRQVLVNLIGNAVKFTNTGAINVKVCEAQRDSGKFIRFQITDSGIGIDDDEKPRLFEVFNHPVKRLIFNSCN